MRKLTTIKFKNRAKLIHNNKYDYSLVEYVNSKMPVKIICPSHGIFEQRPNDHLNGRGCFKCGVDIVNEKKKSNKDDFINKANFIHNNRYDYSLVNYISSNIKVNIVCPSHGIFEQTPNNHLTGQRCPVCYPQKIKKTNEFFIDECRYIHGDKYDYSLVEYINSKIKIKIICKKHGVFEQRPNSHLLGQGCPNCNESKGELEICNYLEKKKIKYIREWSFSDCKNINELRFDFYLPDLNILIEYNGVQHYIVNEHFGGKLEFDKRRVNDRIKIDYAKANGIKLIIIPYWKKVSLCLSELI